MSSDPANFDPKKETPRSKTTTPGENFHIIGVERSAET